MLNDNVNLFFTLFYYVRKKWLHGFKLVKIYFKFIGLFSNLDAC